MKSILQSKKRCYICRKEIGLHDHHIYFGTAKRKISERHGFKVWLCFEHHEGTFGVHGKNSCNSHKGSGYESKILHKGNYIFGM